MRKTAILFSALSLLFAAASAWAEIKDYSVYFAACLEGKTEYIALRRYSAGGDVYLAVNPSDLTVRIGPLQCAATSWEKLATRFKDSPYMRGIQEAEKNDTPLQDAGITHFLPTEHGIDLTIDLCPSRLPLDRIVFRDLIEELGKVEKPVPLAISITGVWMEEHPEDLKWLLELQANGYIAVDWVNHTFHHRTSNTLPLRENFILEKGTDIPKEILMTEIKMLENGMTPSVFFRFPGLVSDVSVFQTITSFGLITIGSDAWLAKNQRPRLGSIVLVHANGNDPIGVRDFLRLLREKQPEARARRWMLYDLRDSVARDISD